MSPHCADEAKYNVVRSVSEQLLELRRKDMTFAGQKIAEISTVNGIRVTLEDGSWGLVRASSNKPKLVIVCESPVSESRMREAFSAIDGLLGRFPEVGAYNQKI